MDLCKLVQENSPPVIGIVKEEEQADAELGVVEFTTKYFNCGSLYLDEARSVYQQLGDRKISIPIGTLLRPWKLWGAMKELGARVKEKGVEGNMKGDGLVQGGIVVVGPAPKCDVLYTYLEETGKPIPAEEIDAALARCSELAQAPLSSGTA